MRKTLTWLIALVMTSHLQAQVMLTLQLPPQGLTIKPQLWSLALVNTSELMQVKIEMVMTDVSTNQQVFTGVTRIFSLPTGTKQLQYAELMPVTYSILNPGYGIDANPDGFLPMGVFNLCYTVMKVINDASERLTEECETVQIEPISPPQLIMPADSEHVEITRPLFTWLPPSPISLFNSLYYDWVLVEVMPMQSGPDAVQQNIPLYQQQNLKTTNFQLPMSVAELDTGKVYAWRISAKNNISVVAHSEVWTFKVGKMLPSKPAAIRGGSYSKLAKEETASTILTSGAVRFEYLNEINSNSVQVKVFDISSASRKRVNMDSSAISIRYGQNFIELQLDHYPEMRTGHIYLLELINAKGERWYLKFEFRKPD